MSPGCLEPLVRGHGELHEGDRNRKPTSGFSSNFLREGQRAESARSFPSKFAFPAVAERGGFEPPIRFNPYNGLANRRLQPLGHLSIGNLFHKIPSGRQAHSHQPQKEIRSQRSSSPPWLCPTQTAR